MYHEYIVDVNNKEELVAFLLEGVEERVEARMKRIRTIPRRQQTTSTDDNDPGSSNGRTADSESVNGGSTPSPGIEKEA